MPKLPLLPLTLLTSLLILCLAGPAAAGPLYRWTAADGSTAFSDDLKRIPSQYRSSAVRVRSGDLASYKRYTPAESRKARSQRSLELAERIERLRAINAAPGAEGVVARGAGPETILQLDDRTSISIPSQRMNGDEPIVVEERRVRDRNNISTTHVTVVRQGEEILSVVRPESAHDRGDWADESELLGEE